MSGYWWVVPLVIFSQFCLAMTHVIPTDQPDHWAMRPWLTARKMYNWFHVFSFFSYMPVVIPLLWIAGLDWFWWVVAGVGSQLSWWIGKRIGHKNWPFWFNQL